MDPTPRVSLAAPPPPTQLPSLSTVSSCSSGSFPIRAPPTPDDDDEGSDFESNFPRINYANSNCSDDIYCTSSSYEGFESGEDFEKAPQEPFPADVDEEIVEDDEGSYTDLFFGPLVAEPDPDDEIAEETGDVGKNCLFRPFVADPDDETVEDDAGVDKNRFFRPFTADPDKEMMGENGCVDKDRFFRLFIAESDEDSLENGSEVERDDYAGEEICSNLESMEIDDVEDSNRVVTVPIARLSIEFDDDAELSVVEDFEDDDALRIPFFATVEGRDKVSECSISEVVEEAVREVNGTLLGTESCAVSVEQSDLLEMNSGEHSAFKNSVEYVAMNDTEESLKPILDYRDCSEAVEMEDASVEGDRSYKEDASWRSENVGLVDANSCSVEVEAMAEEHLPGVGFESSDVAESTETAFQKNETDDLSQLKASEEAQFTEHEDLEDVRLLNSSSVFNFTALNLDLELMAENLVFENDHKDDEEEKSSSKHQNLSEEQRTNLELLKKKFLRLVNRLGFSPQEDPIAAHVLHLLSLATDSPIELEAAEEESSDFSLNILVLGKPGVGKSSTINSIFREQKVQVNAFEPATTTAKEVVGTLSNGIKLRILDTPGPTEQGFNRKTLASLKKFPIDAVLYVDRLDSHDNSYNDLPLLKAISNSLGASIWQNVIVVLTHGSCCPPNGQDGPGLSCEEFVRQRYSVIQRYIRVVNPDIVAIHPVLLVENNYHSGEKSQEQQLLLLLLCCSVKTLNEARSLLKVSTHSQYYSMKKWRGDTEISVHVRSRILVGRRNRFDAVVGLDASSSRGDWNVSFPPAPIAEDRPVSFMSFRPLVIPALINFFFFFQKTAPT